MNKIGMLCKMNRKIVKYSDIKNDHFQVVLQTVLGKLVKYEKREKKDVF